MFYGWSWIVKEKIYNNFLCLGLHPSKLPEYKVDHRFNIK